MRIIVCGPRDFEDEALVRHTISQLYRKHGDSLEVAHGGCSGADMITDKVCRSVGLVVRVYPAEEHGAWPSCGPKRNRHMHDKERPNAVVAFLKPGQPVKGTASMVDIALRAGTTVWLRYSKGGR